MTATRHQTRSFRWGFAALLAGLATLGPFSVDTYLPAFAAMQESLGTTTVGMQQTLSSYLFAFGLMFLFHGALSDAFGRRPVIIVSLVTFTAGTIGAALANTLEMLILWRVVQGLSVGAGMVVGRAMVRDLFNQEDSQRLMSLITLFFGVAPAIAPIIGGWLFIGLGWRSIFWFIAAVSVVLFIVSWRYLPETLAPENRQSFHPVALLAGYKEVGMNRRFLLLSLAVGFNFNAFFLYILSAPVFLGEHLKLGPQEYAWLFIPGILGIMVGAQLSGRAAGRLKPPQTVKRAYGFMAAASLANLAYALTFAPSIPWAVIPIMFYAIGTSMAMPSISIITMDLFPTRRGMAASLQGFVSGMINTVTAGLISPAVSHDPRWLAGTMVGLMALGLGSWMLYLRELRRGAEPPSPVTEG